MQGNIPRVPLDPTQSHLSFMCSVLRDPDRRPRRGPSRCLVCGALEAICCLLTVAYRIAEEHVCASGSPSALRVTTATMSLLGGGGRRGRRGGFPRVCVSKQTIHDFLFLSRCRARSFLFDPAKQNRANLFMGVQVLLSRRI